MYSSRIEILLVVVLLVMFLLIEVLLRFSVKPACHTRSDD
jgi:hypothetical protein